MNFTLTCNSLYRIGANSDVVFICTHFDSFLWGLAYTLKLTASAMLCGLAAGMLVAALRMSKWSFARTIGAAYVELFRNTPVLVQLIWIFYALPILIGLTMGPFESVLLALTMSAAAYYGEIFRAGIQAVPRDQTESATVLGLSTLQKVRFVIGPQAVRVVVPALLSMSITLFKETSLVHWLGIVDLMGASKKLANEYYTFTASYTTAAALYFIIAAPSALLVRKLEIHMARALAR